MTRQCLVLSLSAAAMVASACAPKPPTTGATIMVSQNCNERGFCTDVQFGKQTNPFFVESTLAYHAPRFDLIHNEDYQVALEEGMRQQLVEADKTRIKSINQELSKLSTEFTNKLLAGTKGGALVVSNPTQLAGLTDDEIKTAAEAAKQRGLTGKWVIPIRNTTQQPAQAELTNRATREQLFELSTLRTARGDSNDTKNTVRRMAELRAEKAKL